MKIDRKRQRTGRGQSLVEFALIAPLFLTLLFGIIEGGRLLWTVHTVNNAAKEGARYTTVRGSGSIQSDAPATESKITTYMLSKGTGLNSDELSVELVLLDGNMNDKSRFRVEASYEYDFILASMFGLGSITLTSESTDMFWREVATS